MNQNDDPKIRELLKKSPTLTPPESFYRGVLQRIERKKQKQESATPWYWGFPARALASACVLMIVAVVTRQTKEKQPELMPEARQAPFQSESKPAPATFSAKPLARVRKADVPMGDYVSKEKRYAPKTSPAAPVTSQPVRADKSFWAEEQSNITRRSLASDEKEKADKREESPEESKQSTLENSLKKVVSVVTAVPRKMVPSRGASAGSEVATASAPQPMEWRGKASGIETFRQVVVRDPAAWESLWSDHTRPIVSPPAAPTVDFGQNMVLGIFAGSKPSSGYSIGIATIRQEPNRLVVIYYEMEPEPDGVYGQALTQPYALQVVPRTDLPVVFLKAK